ncbi:MAG: hypothetical protein E2O68_04040, partial [Deltaproteobacteria bacterium]
MKTLLLLGILLTGCKIGTATFDGLTGGDGATGPIPPKPTDLNLSDPEEGVLNLSWVHGAEAFSTFVFKWKNPTENFDHAEVTMSWRDSNGSIERRDYILPNEPESHTFTSIMLEECVRTYFPTVRAVGPQGAVSEPEYSPQNIRYDNTNPQPVTKINVFENDGETPGKAVTADWSGGPGSDNCGIDHYEIAIGYDADSNNELDPIEIKNVLNFTRIPGEKGGVKSFQAVDGYTFTDEKGATHTFLFKEPLQEDVDYFTTIRVVDGAGFFIDSSPSLRWIALPGPTIGFPPDPPTNLSLSSSWITGNPPVPSPEFSWTNPSGNFSHVEVSLGVYIENELIFNTDYEKALNPQSHIFTKFLLIQCSGFYVPKAISVNSLGNKSRSVVYFDGFRYDNTNPTPVTFIDVSKIDGIVNETVFKANTVDWSTGPGSDNCGIAKYEMAIGLDANSNGVLDPGEQIDDVQPFQVIPGGNDITRYQAESGEDGFNFTLESGKKYFTSIKIFDGAGLSSLVFTSEVWDTPGSGKPLDPPTELALSSKWVRGYDLVSSPLFTWVNPGENEFSHAVVNLGIIDEENGTTTFLGSESLGPGDNNHIFINFPLKECRNLYFPMVSSVTDQGIQSEPNLFFDGFRYDNTSPTPVTNIDVSAQDSSLTDDMDDITRAPTTTWSPGTDNCSGIKYFEIAIGTSPSDIESILSFIKVPGGDMTTSFQVVDGEVLTYEEGATYTV